MKTIYPPVISMRDAYVAPVCRQLSCRLKSQVLDASPEYGEEGEAGAVMSNNATYTFSI